MAAALSSDCWGAESPDENHALWLRADEKPQASYRLGCGGQRRRIQSESAQSPLQPQESMLWVAHRRPWGRQNAQRWLMGPVMPSAFLWLLTPRTQVEASQRLGHRPADR